MKKPRHYEYAFMQITPCSLLEADDRISNLGGERWRIHTIRYWSRPKGREFPGADITLERDDLLLNKIEDEEDGD